MKTTLISSEAPQKSCIKGDLKNQELHLLGTYVLNVLSCILCSMSYRPTDKVSYIMDAYW